MKIVYYEKSFHNEDPLFIVETDGKLYGSCGCQFEEFTKENIKLFETDYSVCLSHVSIDNNVDSSEISNFSCMFSGAKNFNEPLNIDTKNGAFFTHFLRGATSFNQEVTIDLTNAKGMYRMLEHTAMSEDKKLRFLRHAQSFRIFNEREYYFGEEEQINE